MLAHRHNTGFLEREAVAENVPGVSALGKSGSLSNFPQPSGTLPARGPVLCSSKARGRRLQRLCECLQASRGALLSKFAAPPEFMFIVLRGALRASLPRGGGHLEQLLIYGPGGLLRTGQVSR